MKKLTLLTIMLALAIPGIGMAQHREKRGGDRMFDGDCGPKHEMGFMNHGSKMKGKGIGRILMHAEELDLSERQQDQLKEMAVAFQLEQIDRKADVKKAKVQLKALMSDDAPEAEVMRAIDDAARLKADLHKMRYKHRKEIESVLTDEQKGKLKSIRKERRFESRDGERIEREIIIEKRHGRGL